MSFPEDLGMVCSANIRCSQVLDEFLRRKGITGGWMGSSVRVRFTDERHGMVDACRYMNTTNQQSIQATTK
jgi:hypothetical protein